MFTFKKVSTFFATAVFILVMFYAPFQTAKLNTQYAFAGGAASGLYTTAQGAAAYIEQGISAVNGTITAAATKLTSFNTGSLLFKEKVLDPIVWSIGKTLLSQFTQSIVNWINSGFEGSPAFVSDLKGFLLNVADEAAGEFINEKLGLGFLCEPFQLNIQIALAIQYNIRTRDNQIPECTLSDIVDNIQGFLNGNFADGGWEGWLAVTQQPANNTEFGQYLAASLELDAYVASRLLGEKSIIDWGEGFLSSIICNDVEGKSNQNCFISNPGKVIQEQLNKALGLPQDTLVVADEFNEIISALFNQLAKQAITGVNGLLGLSGKTYSSSGVVVADGSGETSYVDRMVVETQGGSAGDDQFSLYRTRLNDWITYQESVVSVVDGLIATNNSNRASYPGCYSLSVPSSLTSKRTRALNDINTANTVTFPKIDALKARFDNAPADAAVTLADANPGNDKTVGELQNEIITELTTLEDSGEVPTELDLATAEAEDRRGYQDIVGNFQTSMSNEVSRCRDLESSGSGSGSGEDDSP